jgi:hypothetical protein
LSTPFCCRRKKRDDSFISEEAEGKGGRDPVTKMRSAVSPTLPFMIMRSGLVVMTNE